MSDDVNWTHVGDDVQWPHNVRWQPVPGVIATSYRVHLYHSVGPSVWSRPRDLDTDRRPALFLLSLVILHPETESLVKEILSA